MAITAVFFDAAGTLIKPVRKVGESYSTIAANYDLQVSPVELNGRFHVSFDGATPLAFPGADPTTINTLERRWWKKLVRKVFEPWEPFEKFDAFFDELFDYFSRPQAWTLFPEVRETLAALKERGLILDVISNFDSRLIQILKGLDIAECFAEIIVSSRVGHAKPDRRIFEIALRQHDLAPEHAAHIGDSEENDLRGARNAGLRGFLVDRSTPSSEGARISSLKEMLHRLDD